MSLDAAPLALTETAFAKVNLALHLRRRRPDGYHDLETVFAFAEFGDALSAVPAAAVSLTVGGAFGAAAGAGTDNLVLHAAHALADAAGVMAGAALTLDKCIPVAAGLGGGSADAAAALRLLCRLWRLDWPQARLEALAAGLGADVPACVRSKTRFGSGRGDVLAPWPGVGTIPMLLVNPGVAVPTGQVFAGWDGIDLGGIAPGAALAGLRNDMTAAAIAIAPVVAEVLAALDATGAELVRMSGSGATCLALYADLASRDAAAAVMVPRGWWHRATTLR